MRYLLLGILIPILGTGCVSNPPKPGAIEYLPVPEGYLQPCEVPELPRDTGKLSDAFVQAAQCAVQGNEDKAAIRDLVN